MTVSHRCTALIGLICALTVPAALADATLITWPAGWEVQDVPPAPDDNGQRQRAVRTTPTATR